MEYSDDLVELILKKWNLPPSTIKSWKTRGTIPDKYAQTPLPQHERASYVRLLLTLKDGRLDLNEIKKSTGVPVDMLKAGDIKELTHEQFVKVRKYLNNLVVTLKKARTLETLADTLKHPGYKPLLTLKPLGETQEKYMSHLKNTSIRSIRGYSYDIKGACKLLYEFAEQIKV